MGSLGERRIRPPLRGCPTMSASGAVDEIRRARIDGSAAGCIDTPPAGGIRNVAERLPVRFGREKLHTHFCLGLPPGFFSDAIPDAVEC